MESEEFNLFPTVELVDVSKRYFPFFSFQKYVDAVNNITMTFYKNEIAVILGENGSGKTTLISLITGVIKPSRGNCYLKFADTRSKKDMEYFRRQIGVCHQYNNIRNYSDLTVLQHMILFTCLRGKYSITSNSYSAAYRTRNRVSSFSIITLLCHKVSFFT